MNVIMIMSMIGFKIIHLINFIDIFFLNRLYLEEGR